ncbi:MAG TPA: 30S ribosome-binding factor RbfA [Gammaproteobacteria bacterium]|jgi:ribosome-binding factor A|nr:30S ribosome-binding factor RbfA [Gammaproteobacteria bacterium]
MKHKKVDRTQRIGDLIQKTLATMLLQDMSDERFRFVTVTGVVLSRDLGHAKVYVSVLNDDAKVIEQTVDALNRAAKPMRYHLAQEVKMRIVPELRFVYDESTAHGFYISNLIEKANKKQESEE